MAANGKARPGTRLKLLLVSQYFWPEHFGINALAGALCARGIEVTVLTGKPNYPEGALFEGYARAGILFERHDGMDVIRLPILPRGRRSKIRLALNYLSFIVSGLLLGPWVLRGRGFDAVLVYATSPLLQALPALWLARLKSAPLALWVQDLWPESLSATGFVRSKCLLRAVGRVVRFIYQRTEGILIPSEAFRKPIAALAQVQDRVYYYPNAWVGEPLGEGLAEPGLDALAWEIASGFSVVFAGNLGTAQALDTLLDAAQALQASELPVRIFLVGSGSLSGWLEQQVHDRGLRNVRLPGRFPASAMGRLYGAASALLVSLRDEPIFAYTIPSKVQGYLAAGRPVIAALNGEGARIVACAGAGIACPAGDGHALAQAIRRMYMLSPQERDRMGQRGRDYALAHFSLDSLAEELDRYVRQLAQGTSPVRKEEKL